MHTGKIIQIMMAILIVNTSAIWACPPVIIYTEGENAYGGAVSLLVFPDGSGDLLDRAQAYGGMVVDGSFRFPVLGLDYMPTPDLPAEMIPLDVGDGFPRHCIMDPVVDAGTDGTGWTTWSGPFYMGGNHGPDDDNPLTLEIWLCPNQLASFSNVYFNSPDINGDLLINLTDVAIFADCLINGPYDYGCDFGWDGVINLSDVALMARAWGKSCP